jgi:hypothetical protein
MCLMAFNAAEARHGQTHDDEVRDLLPRKATFRRLHCPLRSVAGFGRKSGNLLDFPVERQLRWPAKLVVAAQFFLIFLLLDAT